MCEFEEDAKESRPAGGKGMVIPPRDERVEILDVAELDSLPTEKWTSYVHPPTLDRIGKAEDVSLMSPCKTCGGEGGWHPRESGEWNECPFCDGIGFKLNAEGMRILELVQEHLETSFDNPRPSPHPTNPDVEDTAREVLDRIGPGEPGESAAITGD